MRNSASIIALLFVFVAGAPNVRADTIVPSASYVLAADGTSPQEGLFTGSVAPLSASETIFFGNGDRYGQFSDWASVSSTSAAANAQATADTSSEVDAGASASITYHVIVKQFKPTLINSVFLDVNGTVSSFASSAASGNFAAATIELFDNSTDTMVARILGSSNCLIGECTAPSGEPEEEVTPLVSAGDSLQLTLQAHCVVSSFSGGGTCSALADPAVTIDPRSPDAADFGLEFSSNLPQEAPAAQVPEPCGLAFVLFGFGLVLAMQKRQR
jgi:hypothetical protein